MMSESVTLELDKFDHKFCGFMSKHDLQKIPLARLKVDIQQAEQAHR